MASNSRNPKDLRNMIALETDKDMEVSLIESGDFSTENKILKSRIDEQSHLIMTLRKKLDDTSLQPVKTDMGDTQNNLSKLKGLSEDDKTEIAMLRSRIDEQSQLIMILKQKADNASSHYYTLERVNKELIEFRDNAKDQIENEIRKYNILNNRFDDLAHNHQEMIKFKDEYKRSNQDLRLENSRLRDENARLFSDAINEKDAVISDLQRKLGSSKEQYNQLEQRFKQNVQEHRTKEENLRMELKNVQEQLKTEIKTLTSRLNDTEEKLKAANYKLQNQIDGRKNNENESAMKLQQLTKEKDDLLDLAMQRGKMIQKEQTENKKLQKRIEEMERAVRNMEEKFERESAAVNANLQVRKLRDELTETDGKFKDLIKKTKKTHEPKYRRYEPEALTNAYLAVKDDNMPIQRAARCYGVPVTTLRERVVGIVSPETLSSGPAPLFSQEEEAYLANYLKSMASFGYGYSRSEVIELATEYAVDLGIRDKDKLLTLQWFYNFMSRWPDLDFKKPRSLSVQRAKATSKECVEAYFIELKKIMEKYNLQDKPERIFNVDEKGLVTEHRPSRVVAGVDSDPPEITSGRGANVTVIGCGSAQGQQIPPYFIFPGARMRSELLEGTTIGSAGTVTETGWSNGTVFKNYLENHLIKYLPERSPENPVMVLYDGHKSHYSIEIINWAKERHIILFVLPAHTSHVLQPLDVGCFGPFSTKYHFECHRFMKLASVQTISRYDVAKLGCKAYVKSLSPENLQKAFRKSGIYPCNMDSINKAKLLPAEPFQFDKENAGACCSVAGDTTKDVALNTTDDQEDVVEPCTNFAVVTDGNVAVADDIADAELAPGSKVEHTGSSFFKEKGQMILNKKKTGKRRRRNDASKIVSGKAVTEKEVLEKLENHQNIIIKSKESNCKKRKVSHSSKANSSISHSSVGKAGKGKISKMSKKSNKSNKCVHESPKPGTSCLSNGRGGPLPVSSESSLDSDDECDDDDDEKCCVCNLFQPKELKQCVSVIFTKWAQCMFENCTHWVHLKYCCSVSVLRRNDTFYCPCHGLPCKPQNEE